MSRKASLQGAAAFPIPILLLSPKPPHLVTLCSTLASPQGAAYASELLPLSRRVRINPARNSQLYVKTMEAPAGEMTAPGKRIGF